MIILNNKKILISGVGKGIGKAMLFHCLKKVHLWLDSPNHRKILTI